MAAPTELKLRFKASRTETEYAKLFLATGGSLNAACGAGKIDLSVTGSKNATCVSLTDEMQDVEMVFPAEIVKGFDAGSILLSTRTKLNAIATRVGTAINGTIVDTNAGGGSVYLANLFRASQDGHVQLPIVYGTLASHSATLAFSGVHVVDGAGECVNIAFVNEETEEKILQSAEEAINAWAEAGWNIREKSLIYAKSPTLTKTVARSPVGLNDSGYDLVHNCIDREFPYSVTCLDSLIKQTMANELEFDAAEVSKFLEETKQPSLRAAEWTQSIGAACSTIANYLVAYRADGRTTIGAKGSQFVAVESWIRSCARSPCESNDCDGSALLITSVLQRCADATPEELAKHDYVRAVRNAICPFYTFGIGIVAARSAEASGGHGSGGVAGHAVAVMMPTLTLLDAIHDASGFACHGEPAKTSSAARELRAARFEAIFTPEILA